MLQGSIYCLLSVCSACGSQALAGQSLAGRLQEEGSYTGQLMEAAALRGVDAHSDAQALREAHSQLRLKNKLILELREHKRQLAGISSCTLLLEHAILQIQNEGSFRRKDSWLD